MIFTLTYQVLGSPPAVLSSRPLAELLSSLSGVLSNVSVVGSDNHGPITIHGLNINILRNQKCIRLGLSERAKYRKHNHEDEDINSADRDGEAPLNNQSSKHVSDRALKLLKFGEAIEDLDINPEDREDEDEEHQMPCKSCVLGKHARSPFKPRTERRKNALELVPRGATTAAQVQCTTLAPRRKSSLDTAV